MDIGERICTAVLSHLSGLTMDHTWRQYIRGQKISPTWQAIGEEILRRMEAESEELYWPVEPRDRRTVQ